MFDIGFSEMLLCAIIALLVLGPERLPQAARTAGRWVGKARHFIRQMSEEFDRQIQADELREKIRKEGDGLGINDVQKSVREALSDVKEFNPVILPPDAEPTSQAKSEAPVAEAPVSESTEAGSSPRAANEAPAAASDATTKH